MVDIPKSAKKSRDAQVATERKAIFLTRNSDCANALAYAPGEF